MIELKTSTLLVVEQYHLRWVGHIYRRLQNALVWQIQEIIDSFSIAHMPRDRSLVGLSKGHARDGLR